MELPISSSRGPMGSLLGKLDSLLESQQFLRKPVRKNFELLKEDLAGIDTFLQELSDEDDPNLMKKYWMKEVREICYDIEDYIDWLIHSEAKIGSVGAVPRLKISRLPSTLIPRPKIASQIKELRARLEDAGERHKRYVLDNNTSSNSSYSVQSHWIPEWYSDREAASVLVGIDDSKAKLINLLNNGEKQLNIISICGFGGIGKTTLAKQLLQELGGQFGCRAFVRASRKPDTRSLLRSILSQTGCHNQSEACNVQQLIDYLNEHLQHRRYLIVIDDLWDTAVWDFLVRAFPDGTPSSRIITTTTTENVAMACCGNRSDYILKMEPLNDDDSRKLFFARVFGSENKCPQQFKDASYEIVRKCGGVPLAVIHIAGLLAHQQDKSEKWDYVERALGSNLSISPTYEGMRKVINLSYNGLPQCLKTCLQYVNMYPENCTIWKDDLLRRWVAEGFIEGDREVTAQSYLEELVYRGMIQPIDINYNDKVLSCTVHHMVLDFVTKESAEDNFITKVDYSQNTRELSSKVRRLFLFYSTAKYAAKLSGITLSQVRSLAFYGFVKCLPSIWEFKFVRVLVLHLWGDYNDSTRLLNLSRIDRLFQLRYLKVTCNFVLQLPTHIGGLHRLKTLEINAKVTSVPEDIVHLKYLVHLCLPAETKLTYKMGCLRSLRTLKYFDLCGNSDYEVKSLQELSYLEELQLVLTTAPSDSVDRNLKVLFSVLGHLYNLKSLVLVRAASFSENFVPIIDSSSMSYPTDGLERLELHRATCIFCSVPKWIGELGNLCILKLGVLEILKNDVDSLAGLQVLVFLSLYVRRPTVDQIVFDSRAFPALKCFKFRSGVLWVAFRPGAMPKLHRLKLSFNAYSGVEYGDMLVGIEHLLNLQVVSARIGASVGAKESDKRTAESALKDAISKHSMIPRINVQIVDWIEDDQVPARNTMLSKMRIVKLFEDDGFPGDKSVDNTNKKADGRTSTFSDVVVTSSDVLNSDDKWKSPPPPMRSSSADKSRFEKERSILQAFKDTDRISKHITIHQTSHVQQEKLQPEEDDDVKEEKGMRHKYVDTASSFTDSVHLTEFSFREIEDATNKFHDTRKIGEGGFGTVYKGNLRYTTVAIKIFNPEGRMAEEEFSDEVRTLSRIRHPNLVNLLGVCSEAKAAVYEYFPTGSLENHLQHMHQSPLPWIIRIRIACDVCTALLFLHYNKPKGIVHGDVNTRNIYLDSHYCAKLGYFRTYNRTLLPTKGTLPYMDPLYFATMKSTEQSDDVCSFGVMMLQLLTGKSSTGIDSVVELALSRGTLHGILDASAGKWSLVHAEKIARIALACCQLDRKACPDLGKEVWPALLAIVKEATIIFISQSMMNKDTGVVSLPTHR